MKPKNSIYYGNDRVDYDNVVTMERRRLDGP